MVAQISRVLFELFVVFFKIGAVGFGGGLAMLPYIEKQVTIYHQWISNQEFLDLLAISQSTPGPIAINTSTFVGFRVGGVIGAVVACFGLIFFSMVVINLLTNYLEKNTENIRIKNLFLTLRPITVGLILAAAFSVGRKVLIDPISLFVAVVAFGLLAKAKWHPITVVLGFGIIGVVAQAISQLQM